MVTDSDKIAKMIASIINSTRYAHDVWDALEHAEKETLIALWAAFIQDVPETADAQILASI